MARRRHYENDTRDAMALYQMFNQQQQSEQARKEDLLKLMMNYQQNQQQMEQGQMQHEASLAQTRESNEANRELRQQSLEATRANTDATRDYQNRPDASMLAALAGDPVGLFAYLQRHAPEVAKSRLDQAYFNIAHQHELGVPEMASPLDKTIWEAGTGTKYDPALFDMWTSGGQKRTPPPPPSPSVLSQIFNPPVNPNGSTFSGTGTVALPAPVEPVPTDRSWEDMFDTRFLPPVQPNQKKVPSLTLTTR